MHALSEPLVSIHVESNSISRIQLELASFGLNPLDWRALHVSQSDQYRLILVHCDDEDLRLSVNVKNTAQNKSGDSMIEDLEMIVL